MRLVAIGRAGMLAAFLPILSASAAMQQPGNVLTRIERGQWTLQAPNGNHIAAICLGDPARLVQPHHGAAQCTQSILSSDDRSTTFSYTCPGIGNGRTMIRYETPRLLQIDSQGLDRGRPFAVRIEARRTGAC